MKKIFTLIAVALAATSVNAQEESYVAATSAGMASEYKAVIDADGVATNVENGSSIVKFGTTNVSVEAVGSADPADGASGGQDITPGAKIGDNLYELTSINSTKPIKWELKIKAISTSIMLQVQVLLQSAYFARKSLQMMPLPVIIA